MVYSATVFELTHHFFFKWLYILSTLLMVSACNTISPESFYEGVRSQDRAKNPSQALTPSPSPNYFQYQQERERLKRANEGTAP